MSVKNELIEKCGLPVSFHKSLSNFGQAEAFAPYSETPDVPTEAPRYVFFDFECTHFTNCAGFEKTVLGSQIDQKCLGMHCDIFAHNALKNSDNWMAGCKVRTENLKLRSNPLKIHLKDGVSRVVHVID